MQYSFANKGGEVGVLRGSKKYWVIAVLCGLMASLLFYRYLQDIKTRYLPDDLIKVVRATTPIERDTLITDNQVEVLQLPAKYVHPDSLQDKESVVGKIAVSDIAAGEEILKQKLLSPSDKTRRLAYSVPENKRAVSIPIDSISGVSGFIEPGDRVDIVGTVDIPVQDYQGNEKPASFSILVLQDIEVLAVGINPDANGRESSSGDKTLTLAVSTEEAQPLVLASERGRLRLLLRSPIDDSKADLEPYQLEDFLKESQ